MRELENMRERQLIADGGIKSCFQQASKTAWKEVGRRAPEKAVLLLVRAAEKAEGESGVP